MAVVPLYCDRQNIVGARRPWRRQIHHDDEPDRRDYSSLGWDTANRYKMLGYKINFEGEDLYIFDLSEPEIFAEGRGRKKAKQETMPQGDGYSPDNWQTSLGMPVEEHKTALNISMIDGYVSMEAVNGSKLGSTPEGQTT